MRRRRRCGPPLLLLRTGTPSLSVELAEGPARFRRRRRCSRRRTGEETSTSFCFTYLLDAEGNSPVHAADRHCLPSPSIVTVVDGEGTSVAELRCCQPLFQLAEGKAVASTRRLAPPRNRGGVPLEWDVRELPSPSRTAAMLHCHNAGRFPEEITAELHLVVATLRRKVKADEETPPLWTTVAAAANRDPVA
nr:hypothetical protein Itr_chr02CG12200 [Ipomoea trifida]